MHTEGGPIEMVHGFTYLGSNITVDGEIRDEVKCRIGKAARALSHSDAFKDLSFKIGVFQLRQNRESTGPQFCQYFYMEQKHGLLKQRA